MNGRPYLPRWQRSRFEQVVEAAGQLFNLSAAEVRKKSNCQSIVLPRSIAMYVMHRTLGASMPAIGRAFGGKHHTTVFHAVRKIERLKCTDEDIAVKLRIVEEAAGSSRSAKDNADAYQVEITLP